MKKVMYVAHENVKGGATHSLLNILDHLPNDIKPVVLVPKSLSFAQHFKSEYRGLIKAGSLVDELKKRNITYYHAYFYYDNLNMKMNLLKKFFFSVIRSNELKRIGKTIKNERICIVHSNSSVIRFGADVAKDNNIPHFWHIREDVREMLDIPTGKLQDYYSSIIKKSDKVIFVSEELKANFEQLNGYESSENKFITIHNGIPLVENTKALSDLINKNEKKYKIYSFGTVYKIKGQEDLIDLAKKLKDEKSIANDFIIKIVGSSKPEYYNYLMNKLNKYDLKDVVEFIDYTNDLETFRRDASMEIICSRNEAFGRVAVEALHFGNPLIVTNVGGLNEIVEDGISGLKYSPGDISQLYKHVISIMKQEINVSQMIEKGKRRAELFNIKNCVNQIYQLYQRRK